MDLNGVGIPLGKSSDRGFSSMRGTIIGNPEDSSCRAVGLLIHDEIHQLVVCLDSCLCVADPKELGSVDIPSGKVGQCAHSFVFEFHAPWLMRQRSHTDELSVSGLNAGLFIRADHVVIRPQGAPFEHAEIEVQDSGCLFSEERVSRKKPTPMLPRLYRVAAEAAPDGSDTDGHYNAPNHRFPGNIGGTEAGERETQSDGEFTGERLDFHHALRGKKSAVVRTLAGLPDRPSFRSRSVSSIW